MYCSEKCQRACWKVHKTACRLVQKVVYKTACRLVQKVMQIL